MIRYFPSQVKICIHFKILVSHYFPHEVEILNSFPYFKLWKGFFYNKLQYDLKLKTKSKLYLELGL